MNPASPPAESRIPIRQHWQIALLSALLFSPLLIWVWLDRRYWPWDQADYGFASVYLGQLLLTDPAGWFQAMTSVLGYRAPGLPYLAQCAYVFGDTVGRIGPALLTVVVAMLMLGGAIVGMTVRSLCRLEVSLLAVLLIAAAPVSLAMGQTFLVEAPQMAVVAALCGVMVKSPETPLHRLGLQVMLVGTVAMLFKVTSPVYCAGPGLLIAWIVARRMAESRREKPRHEWVRQDWVWLGVTGVVLFFGLLWYGKNGGTILEFIRLNTVDPAGEIYGSNQGVLRKFFLYWLPSVREGYFLPWVYWAGLAATVTAVLMAWLSTGRRIFSRETMSEWPIQCALFCGAGFLFCLTVFSGQINEQSRFVLPALPLFAVAVAVGIDRFKSVWLVRFLTVLLLIQYVVLNLAAFGVISQPTGISEYFQVLQREDPYEDGIREVIRRTAAQPEAADRWLMVGSSVNWLNASTLNYYLVCDPVARHRRNRFYAVPFGATDLGGVWRGMGEKRPVYFVAAEPSQSPPVPAALNGLAVPLLESIDRSRVFRRVEDFRSPYFRIYRFVPPAE